jgi:hypothetical protein
MAVQLICCVLRLLCSSRVTAQQLLLCEIVVLGAQRDRANQR